MPKGIVGKLGVKVAPDLSGFAKELRQKLRKIRHELDLEIPVGLELDEREIIDLERRLRRAKPTMSVKLRLDEQSVVRLQKRIEGLKATVNAKLKVDNKSVAETKRRVNDSVKDARVAPRVDDLAVRQYRAALQRAGASTKVSPELDQLSMRRVKEQIRRQDASTKIVPRLDEPGLTRIRRQLKDMTAVTQAIDPVVDKASLDKIHKALQKRFEERVGVKTDVDKSSYEQTRRKIRKLADDKKVTVNADADTGKASAKLAWLTRPRKVNIQAVVDHAAFAKVEEYIGRLSGGRALTDWGRSLKDVIKNLDKTALTMGTTAAAAAAMGAAMVGAAGNVLALAKGLASIAPAGLALPGIFLGMATSAGVLFTALSTAKDHIQDVVEDFGHLQETIGNRFWDRAAGSVRALASEALPMLHRELGDLAEVQGGWIAGMAEVTRQHLPKLERSLQNTTEGARRATGGFAGFTQGILTIGEVGSRYLPQLGDWFTHLGEKFAAWAEKAAGDGSIDKAILRGAYAAKRSWGIMKDLASIIGSIFKAAEAGGYTLARVEKNIDAIDKALKGVTGQNILKSIFGAAADSMDNFMAKAKDTGPQILGIATNLKVALPEAATAAGIAFQGLTAVLGNAALGHGAKLFFQGLQSGLQSLTDRAPQVSHVLAAILTLGGRVAETVGKVLGAAFEHLGPILVRLLDALGPLVTAMGTSLAGAIEKVAPYVAKFVDQFLIPMINKLAESPQLVNLLVAAFVGMQVLGPIVSTITGLVTAIQGIGSAISFLLSPIGLVVAAIAALIAIFVLLWQNSETFRTTVTAAWTEVTAAFQVVQEYFVNEWWPKIQQVWQLFSEAWTTYGMPLMQSLDAFIQWFQPLWELMWFGVKEIFIGVWQALSSTVSGVLDIIMGLLNIFIGFMKGDWSQMWEGVKQAFSGVWTIISGVVSGAVHVILGFFTVMYTSISTIVSLIAQFVTTWFYNMWNGAVNTTRSAAASVVGLFRDIPNSIRSIFAGAGNWLISAGQSIINGLISGVQRAIGRLRSILSSVTRMIPRWKGPAPVDRKLLKPAGRMIIRGFVSGIEQETPSVKRSLRGLTGRLPSLAVDNEAPAGGNFARNAGPSVTINQYNPVQEPDSSVRDKVASGIRLAASL